jgi:tRNA A37 methylthiotransferase MiaB
VLVEKRSTNGKLLARSAGNSRVVFDGDDGLIGTFVEINVLEAGQAELRGVLRVDTSSDTKIKNVVA